MPESEGTMPGAFGDFTYMAYPKRGIFVVLLGGKYSHIRDYDDKPSKPTFTKF